MALTVGRLEQMEQLANLGDSRMTGFCPYCADEPRTRDHVPAKVFLDPPYPENLPKVEACLRCNNGSSLDEEYLACLIACVIGGGVEDTVIGREKIRRILNERPGLRERLRQSHGVTSAGTVFTIEPDRVRNVVVKLARGHAAFELNEPQLGQPAVVGYVPLHLLDPEQRSGFENPPTPANWPEVGSRALQRAVVSAKFGLTDWVEVQPDRYRYLAFSGDGVAVRMVLSEYLACEVRWSEGDYS